MIVVLGLYRGGSSAVAGVLAHLGVCLGHEIKVVPEAESPRYATWEDWHLRVAALRCFSEPDLEPQTDFAGRVQVLRGYLAARQLYARRQMLHRRPGRDTAIVPFAGCPCQRGGPIGAKFPMLCYLGREIEQAWGDVPGGVRYVSVERDPVVTAESLRRWYGGRAWDLVERLASARRAFLADREHVAVRYDDLVHAPRVVVGALARALQLASSGERFEAAVASVQRPQYTRRDTARPRPRPRPRKGEVVGATAGGETSGGGQ